MPGHHNVMNAAAAVAVASELGIDDNAIRGGLETFAGVGRRFSALGNLHWSGGEALLVDDYGHHPTEGGGLRWRRPERPARIERRLVMVYQPHRYSRTRDLYEDFVAVLSECQVLILLEVYSAGEDPIPGADSRALSRSIRQRGAVEPIYVASPAEVPQVLASLLAGRSAHYPGCRQYWSLGPAASGRHHAGGAAVSAAMLKDRHFAVLLGGSAAEREVSLRAVAMWLTPSKPPARG